MTATVVLFSILPLFGAFVISLIGKKSKRFTDLFASVVTFVLAALAVHAAILARANFPIVYSIGGWAPPIGISAVLDGLSSFMLVTINVIAFLVTLYSIDYMEQFTDKWKFYTLFLLMVAGMNGVAITGDIFNLYVFLEISAIASYALVAFGTEHEELEASFKYMIMGAVASSFILLGIALLYGYASTLNMADLAAVLAQKSGERIILLVSAFFVMGFGLKAAIVPFHAWLPDAHPSAPAPISAMLSGVLIKTLGLYALIRIFFCVFGVTDAILSVFMVGGVLSMMVGVLLAIGQWDMKRLLAYHSISQVGYIILGIGLGTPLGILGGIFHLFNHSIFKSLLFLNSGAVEYSTGTRDLREMGGLNKKMPVTGGTSLIASMSISGIPPFNGFWSKLIIIIACVQSGHYIFAMWAVIGSVLTLASFTKVQKFAFFGDLKKALIGVREVPVFMRISMISLSVICLLGGALLIPFLKPFLTDAVDVILSGKEYALIALRNM
ncbi:MAG: monovalent cation/H+ antiporter subunit D family protein [Candidatus Omnitrophota bacterium]